MSEGEGSRDGGFPGCQPGKEEVAEARVVSAEMVTSTGIHLEGGAGGVLVAWVSAVVGCPRLRAQAASRVLTC